MGENGFLVLPIALFPGERGGGGGKPLFDSIKSIRFIYYLFIEYLTVCFMSVLVPGQICFSSVDQHYCFVIFFRFLRHQTDLPDR